MPLFQTEEVTQAEFDKQHKPDKDIFSQLGYDDLIEERRKIRAKAVADETRWRDNIISPEQRKQWENKGQLTAIQTWHKKDKGELLPYKGTWKQGSKSFKIKEISDKMATGDPITPEERKYFEDYVLNLAEIQTRGYTIGGMAVNIGLQSIPFAVELGLGLLTTGGVSSFGAAATKLSATMAEKGIVKTIGKGIAKTAYNAALNPKTYAMSLTRLPQQVRARMGDILLSDSLAVSPEGQVILKESEINPAIAFMKALALNNIEVASEMSAQILVRPFMDSIGKLGLAITSPIAKRLPKGFADSFVKLAEKVTNMPFLRALDDLGWNGVLEEMGEERVGDLLQAAFNLNDKEGYSFEQFLDAMFPAPEQLASEAISFALTGIGMHGLHSTIKAIPGIGEKYTKDGFLLDTGIFRIKGYDSYLDRKVRETLKEKGKDDEEIDNALQFSNRDEKIQFLKNSKTEFDSKEDYDAKEFEKDLRATEYEDKTYEKLANAGVKQDVAYSASKLMGIFARNLGVNKQAFDNWYNKLFVTNKPANEVNKDGTQFQSAAMKRSQFDNFDDFYNDVLAKPKNTGDKRQFNAVSQDGLYLRIPHDTILHERKKHKLTIDEWQDLLDNIDNVSSAIKSRQKSRFNGKPVLLKINTPNNTYGVVIEAFEKSNPLIATAFIDTEQNIDNWIKKEAIPSGTKTSFLGNHLNNIIISIQPKFKPFNPNVKNGNTYFQSAETAGWDYEHNESTNARIARSEGKGTRKELAKVLGITQNEADNLYSAGGEWHHVGKSFRKETFYPIDAYKELKETGDISKETIDKYQFNEYEVKYLKLSYEQCVKNKKISTKELLAPFVEKYKNDEKLSAILKEVLNNRKRNSSKSFAAQSIINFIEGFKDGSVPFERLENEIAFYSQEDLKRRRIADAKKEWQEKGTDSRFFKKWFGNSKVVDENGEPLVVYHNTNNEFDTFDKTFIGSATDDGLWGRGFYFGNSVNDSYGKKAMSMYLKMENPFRLNDFKTVKEIADYLDVDESNFRIGYDGLIYFSQDQVKQITSHIQDRGHDGVIVRFPSGYTEYIAFSPEQIKSVDNQGTFDNSNPNIYFQEVNEGENDNVVDLTNDFEKTPSLDDVKKYINRLIQEGVKFATSSPGWFVDVKGDNRTKGKILNRGNYKKLNKTQKGRHNKYVMSLEKLLSNAVHTGEKENTKKDKKPNVEKYHYFKTNAKIGDKTYEIIFDTEEYKNDNPQGVDYAKRNSKEHPADINSITDNTEKINPKTVHLYNITELKQANIYYKEANEDERLIAGFTYPQIMDKLVELNDSLENEKDKTNADNTLAKIHVLMDAIDANEHPENFKNEDKRHEIMLNAYYIMNNQEIPKDYIEADTNSQRSYNDLLELHNKKKEKAEKEYYGYFAEGQEQNVLGIMQNSDPSTVIHELGHLFLNGLNHLADTSDEARECLDAVNKWLGASYGEYTVNQQEKFARSFEAYLYKGKAPSNRLKTVFENFKKWLKGVYLDITKIPSADISPEAQEVFDKIFANDSYYQEQKGATELLKAVKKQVRKEKMRDIKKSDKNLTEAEKRCRDVSYDIVATATGKDVGYLKRTLETTSDKNGYTRRREVIYELLDKVEDKITASGGMKEEWKEFYGSYDENDVDGDYKLAEAAFDTIVNKSYFDPALKLADQSEARALYYKTAVETANRQYELLLNAYKKRNRDSALSAIFDWLDSLDDEIKADYENKFIYDSNLIERNENIDKFDKAKRKILDKALQLENRYSINDNEKYKELVIETIKNLNFLNPLDKSKLTANILDLSSVDFLMTSIDNILDIAKTMDDVNFRNNLSKDIHKELQGTKNVKKNGRMVGKYNYSTNKIFAELRDIDRLSADAANDKRLSEKRMATAEDDGLSEKQKLINKFLSYKAGGKTYANTELMVDIYNSIVKLKLIGKYAKSEEELQEEFSQEKDIDELINILNNKKEANPVLKLYVNAVANLESTLNALFNKDIKEKYGSEILYAETQSQSFQYEQKKKFEEEVAKIYNLPKFLWDMKIVEYLNEKHTYTELRRTYDTEYNLIKVREIPRTLTKMDIIQAYIWSKNKVLEERLINQFGEETLEKMFDEMSLEDVKLAELMLNTAQSFYPLVNHAFIKKYGLDLPQVSCYFPSTPERGNEVDLYNDYSSKSLNNSFTKLRADSKIQPMDFHNPVATLYNHIDGVAKFAFMSEALDKANLRFKNLDLKRVIINKYGEDAHKTLNQSLANVTYKKEAPVFNGMNKIIDNIISNWIQANVSIKPIVGLKQLLSANNYAVDMPYIKWQAGFLEALAKAPATIDYMMKIPYLKARFGGSYSNEFLKQTIENSAFSLTKKLKDFSNIFIKTGDIGAIIFGGKPYIDYLIKDKGLSEEEAIKQFILSTNRSQQSSAISSLSNFQVSMTRNPIGKLFIAFKNAPQQYIRMCGDAIVSCANGDISKGQCAKLLFQFGYLQPFLYAAATSGCIWRWAITGDPDDVLKDLKMSIFNLNSNGLPFLGDIYQYALNKLVYKEKVMPMTTPLIGDIERQINKLSKEDIILKDYLEGIGYMSAHVGLGFNSQAVIDMSSGVGDIATGEPAQGILKVIGYTDKRAKHITGND